TTIGLVLSMCVILISKSSMSGAAWENWGWRIPFLASALMIVISIWIRRSMAESPLFAKAKSEGKTSSNPLKESFGNKSNLKVVLLALFGLTMGLGVVGYSSTFYSQSFLIKFMFVDYDQANEVVIIAVTMGIPFYVFFGWLSDRIGRKFILMMGLLTAVLFFRPIFERMYQVTNLRNKVENKQAMQINVKKELLPNSATDSLITTTTLRSYTDGTTCRDIKREVISAGKAGQPEIITSIKVNDLNKWKLIFLIFSMMLVFTMAYGPLAAFIVEMFPLRIRYTSMLLPYHIGNGVFGGSTLVIATYLIEKAKVAQVANYYLAGLNYPIVLMSVSLVIGLLYVKENKEGKIPVKVPSENLNKVKRSMGYVWILLGLAAAYFGLFQLGIPKFTSGNKDDLIFAIIVMFFITPIVSIGLFLFGKYAIEGEYDD
ncbi:MAG TPA: MFS transporter, partial [Mucilaginibacter sp.]|nr:MFS transporter [Mucilaginibacter sp.]